MKKMIDNTLGNLLPPAMTVVGYVLCSESLPRWISLLSAFQFRSWESSWPFRGLGFK